MNTLGGKVALVTGASRGIGRAIAVELAGHGASVVVNYLKNRAAAEAAVAEIQNTGSSAVAVQADAAEPPEARQLVAATVGRLGGLDILVNNAGVISDRTVRNMTQEEWTYVVRTNLDSVFYCTNAAIPHLIDREGGRVVNIASVLGQMGNIGQVSYSASKGGIIAFTKGLALELARYNITVNAVCPGYIETDMMASLEDRFREGLLGRIPLRRFGLPHEVASLVRYLVVEGDYITGQQLNVNGGMYM